MTGLMNTTKYRVTCLTPVHIGTGARLNHFDGFWVGDRWWRIELDRVLAGGVDARALAEAMKERSFRWPDWLRANGLQPAQVSTYGVTCRLNPQELEIREALKDVYQQPYLPGSTLKGALRTALLWWLLDHNDEVCNQLTDFLLAEIRSERQPEPRFLARRLEEELLGKEPNTDLLRALHVTDSAPCATERLFLGETMTFSLSQGQLKPKKESGADFRAFAEWLTAGTELQTSINCDQFLFTPQVRDRLEFNDAQVSAVNELPKVCNAYAQALLRREQDYYDAHALPRLGDLYDRFDRLIDDLPPGACLLNLGWGGGWESKTVGDLLRELLSDESFKKLRRRFNLGKHPDKPIDRYLDTHFPHSRQLATASGEILPLGWVKLEVL
jgi:CRISPR-associated protein Csm5